MYADESFNLLGKLPQKQFVYSKIMLGKAPLRRWPVATRRHTAPHLRARVRQQVGVPHGAHHRRILEGGKKRGMRGPATSKECVLGMQSVQGG